MGYYLPSKSYLRPKQQLQLRQRLIAITTTSILLIAAAVIFISLQFGDNKSAFANTHDAKLTADIDMPVVLANSNLATQELPHPYSIEFPVILAYFKTLKKAHTVALKWSTMLEYKNDFFTVEKSTNGTEFSEIGCIDSRKSNDYSSDYSFTDEAGKDPVAFYRLSQTSASGKTTFIALEKVAEKTENDDLALYIEEVGPQPFNKYFNVNYYSDREGGVSVELFDKSGKKIYKTYTTAMQGFNTCRFLDGATLIDNEYTLRIANSRGAFVKRIKRRV